MHTLWIYLVSAMAIVHHSASACKMTQSEAENQVRSAGIDISSSGRCSDRRRPTCTSLEQINCEAINCIVALKTSSGCSITITGGTETGHTRGTYSHSNGYKLDISLNSCINSYITETYTNIGRRGDGATQYQAPNGNIFAKERHHWDILFTADC